ncbi:uncharacterized protein LOC128964115 [Oppia nitens]|uniref:uncharacterized protein LOC128964115 n=1 Tax=Oppia nitens TaxID=1686743 RepID=UPI0023DA68A1|nr:uncharacterized protein LOC128964115 [Oppia nitens]
MKTLSDKTKLVVDVDDYRRIVLNDRPSAAIRLTDVLIYMRGVWLTMTTLNLFINVYVLMSLDRFLMTYALVTMIVSFEGQIAAIVGQFGIGYSRLLAIIYAISAASLLVASLVWGPVGANHLMTLSLAITLVSGLIGGFIAVKQ